MSDICVYFGGTAREIWDEQGLCVEYEGRVPVHARKEGRDFIAVPCPAANLGDVKAEYALLARSTELAAALNLRKCGDAALAYFEGCARIHEALRSAGSPRLLPSLLQLELRGGAEGIAALELLRVLLDEERLPWEEAAALCARCFELRARESRCMTLSALAELSPRLASLAHAVNEDLCGRISAAFPDDWARVSAGAALREGELRLCRLSAALCGRVFCSEAALRGELRVLYTLEPEKYVLI